DTLLDNFTTDEIEVVFAHELGHQVHRDIARLIATQSLLTMASLFACSVVLRLQVGPLGYDGIADVATLPLSALSFGAVNRRTGRPDRKRALSAVRSSSRRLCSRNNRGTARLYLGDDPASQPEPRGIRSESVDRTVFL